MLPSNIARKQNNYLWAVFLFFKALTSVLLNVGGVDVMAELEDFFDISIRKRRRTKACGRRRESRRNRKDS